jgi:hypothetical protein
MYVCSNCYGPNVYGNAMVNVNDETDVRQMVGTSFFCDDCETDAAPISDDDPEFLVNVRYLIHGYDGVGWAYWSNEDGWVDKESATRFTLAERDAFTLLPDGACCWMLT